MLGDVTSDVVPRSLGTLLSVSGLLLLSFIESEEKLAWAAWNRDKKNSPKNSPRIGKINV